MEVHFLIDLVHQTNDAILTEARLRGLQFALLMERFRAVGLYDKPEERAQELVFDLRDLRVELLSLQLATERIREKYFDGEPMLLRDVLELMELLELQTILIGGLLSGIEECLLEALGLDLKTDLHRRHQLLSDKAEYRVGKIVAFAKSSMFQVFGDTWAARTVIKPFITGAGDTGCGPKKR